MVTYWLLGKATPGLESDEKEMLASPDDIVRTESPTSNRSRGTHGLNPTPKDVKTTWTSNMAPTQKISHPQSNSKSADVVTKPAANHTTKEEEPVSKIEKKRNASGKVEEKVNTEVLELRPVCKTPDSATTDPKMAAEVEYDTRNAAKKTVPDPQPASSNPLSYEEIEKKITLGSVSPAFHVVEGHHF